MSSTGSIPIVAMLIRSGDFSQRAKKVKNKPISENHRKFVTPYFFQYSGISTNKNIVIKICSMKN
jgi:hypothetical protein